MILESKSHTVAVLANGYCTACCQQETKTIFCLVKHLIIYSMKHSPAWEANRFSASQEIPRILFNPKVQYCIHSCPSPVHLLRHLDPVHAQHPTSWNSILILYTHLRLGLPSGLSLSFRFPQQNPVYGSPLPHTRYLPRPTFSTQFWVRSTEH